MVKKDLISGNIYNVKLEGVEKPCQLYFMEQAFNYDNSCDCCGKKVSNGFVFCEKFYGIKSDIDYLKSWESGVYFVGGSACLKKFVSE